MPLAQFFERCLHLRGGMGVAGLLRCRDSFREDCFRLVDPRQASQELPVLEIAGHVARMRREKLTEMLDGGLVVAGMGAFDRQTVAPKGVVWVGSHKLFERLTPRFVRLCHEQRGRSSRKFLIKPLYYSGHPATRKARGGRDDNSSGPGNGTHRGLMVSTHKPGSRTSQLTSAQKGKPVRASRAEMTEVVLPNDANPLGNILGGRVMHLIDIAAALAAHRHSNSYVVTASVDYVDFRSPIRVGDMIILKSSMNRVFHTSMEVGVKVFSENVLSGERKHTSSAYVTFVAIDEHGRPKPVPPLLLHTPQERRRWRDAARRRRIRLAQRYRRRD